MGHYSRLDDMTNPLSASYTRHWKKYRHPSTDHCGRGTDHLTSGYDKIVQQSQKKPEVINPRLIPFHSTRLDWNFLYYYCWFTSNLSVYHWFLRMFFLPIVQSILNFFFLKTYLQCIFVIYLWSSTTPYHLSVAWSILVHVDSPPISRKWVYVYYLQGLKSWKNIYKQFYDRIPPFPKKEFWICAWLKLQVTVSKT